MSSSSSDMMPVFEEDQDEALQAVIEESLLTNKGFHINFFYIYSIICNFKLFYIQCLWIFLTRSDDSEILQAIKMSLAESKKSDDGSNISSDDRSYKDQPINYSRNQSNEDELLAKALQISMNDF